jgi:hypothetical protein
MRASTQRTLNHSLRLRIIAHNSRSARAWLLPLLLQTDTWKHAVAGAGVAVSALVADASLHIRMRHHTTSVVFI